MSDIFQAILGTYIGFSIGLSLIFHHEYFSFEHFKKYFTLKEVFLYIWFLPTIILFGLFKFLLELDIWNKCIFNNKDLNK